MPKRSPRRPFPSRAGRTAEVRKILNETRDLLLGGKSADALAILAGAIARYAECSEVHSRHGDALYFEKQLEEAKAAYARAIRLDATNAQAWYGLGWIAFNNEEWAEAIPNFRRAIRHGRDTGDARFHLGRALFQMGEVDAAIDEYRAAMRHLAPERRASAQLEIAKIIPGSPKRGNAEILRERLKWARQQETTEALPEKPGARLRKPGEKIRVGYVSAYFGSRNWMKPVWGAINEHNRAKFAIHLFYDREKPSAASGYRKMRGDAIHDLTGLSNAAAAKRIAKAGIAILVDLNGYSFVRRLGLWMRRPAPVLAGWFNMYAPTGIRAFDYIIGDECVIPPEEERFYTEKVRRVPGTYLAFRVLYPVPKIVPPPCLKSGRITFGCFAPQYKITDEMVAAWSKILKGAPGTRLVLKNTSLHIASTRESVWRRFEKYGVARKRILLEPPEEHRKFLNAYARVDIALDSFPYNGGTTTMEAMWQGVPALTFRGDRWVARTSETLLRAAGLGEWVRESKSGYIDRAVELARSNQTPGMLAGMRRGMRRRLLESKACDTPGLCRSLERIYEELAKKDGSRGIRQ